MKSRIVLLAAAAIGLTFLSGCSSGKDRPVVEAVAEQSGDVQRVTVKTHTYYFEPNRIIVKVGVPVELTIKNNSMVVPHNFTINAADAGIEIDRGVGMFKGSAVVRFTPTKPGEYDFICGKGSHMMKGMTGVLVVRE